MYEEAIELRGKLIGRDDPNLAYTLSYGLGGMATEKGDGTRRWCSISRRSNSCAG